MLRRLPALVAALAMALSVTACSSSDPAPSSTPASAPAASSGGPAAPGSAAAPGGSGSAPAPAPASPAPAAAPTAPVEGAYAGAGGPRPAEAEPLPTYVSEYGKLKSAHLVTPSGGIGCDFSEPLNGGSQGGCDVPSYRTTKLYGCRPSGSSCVANTRFPFSGNRVGEITTNQGTSGWFDSASHPGYTTPTIAYGKVVYFDDWTCASAMNGLTCWNTATGSGVFLSKERSERFDGPGKPGAAAPSAQASAAPAPAPANSEIVLGSLPSNGQGYGTSRPSSLDNGGSRSGRTEGIVWSSWGGERAEGTAKGPRAMGDIAAGGPAYDEVQLVAFEIGQCNGKRAYRKLAVFRAGTSFDPKNANDVCWTEK